jgi:hypothetical protein
MLMTIQKGLKMSDFKIGDKVKYKNSHDFLGYVSNVYKGQLFLIEDFEILVHLNGVRTTALASELEIYSDE